MLLQEEMHYRYTYRDGNLYVKNPTCRRFPTGTLVGSLDAYGYRKHQLHGKTYKVHRTIFIMHYGYLPECVDHINGVRDDNRIENLRDADACTNQQNRKLNCRNTTGVRGVYRHRGLYRVRIQAHNIVHELGEYKDFELASFIADEARRKLHGEFYIHLDD